MFNIRKGIFETNSSSTHSVCISKHNNYEIPSELRFEVGEYGWENEFLQGSTELASYLYTAIYEICTDRDEINSFKNYIYDTLGKYGCECDFEEPECTRWGLSEGYIDHAYELRDFLESIRRSERKLMRFLFSPDSFIITGNDNEYTYDEIVKKTDFSQVEVYEKGN